VSAVLEKDHCVYSDGRETAYFVQGY